jgi:hypothetical protein
MALKNSNQNYLKISGVYADTRTGLMSVTYDVYETETARHNGLGEFEKSIQGNEMFDQQQFSEVIAGKSVKEQLITLAYQKLKAGNFKDWQDC